MCAAKSLDRQLSRKDEQKALNDNIKAYEKMQSKLEAEKLHCWVVFHDEKLVGTYDDFQTAADHAVRKFGRGPYLIRQVGTRPMHLPASVLYRPAHA